jgi:TetR/AcrR family transcriptional regulator, transcriptional repressor for nem operon
VRDTRGELMTQAERLIRGRGYSSFSYGDLAEVVGIRKASIHHHFPTKTDLARALVTSYDARYDAAMAEIVARGTGAVASLEAYARFYLQGVEDDLGCLCAILAIERDTLPEPLRQDVARFFDKHICWLEARLEDGRTAGSIRPTLDPAAAARMIIAALEGALLMERVLSGERGFRAAVTALIEGLRPHGA